MPGHRYGDKHSYRRPPEMCVEGRCKLNNTNGRDFPDIPQEPRRKVQQRFYKVPAFPGTSVFDLKSGETLPAAKRHHNLSYMDISDDVQEEEEVEAVENADTWSDYTYHSRVLAELESIRTASTATSPEEGDLCGDIARMKQVKDDLSQDDLMLTPLFETAVTPMHDAAPTWTLSDHDNSPSYSSGACDLSAESYALYTELTNKSNALQYKLDDWLSPAYSPSQEHAETCMADYFHVLQRHYDFVEVTQRPAAPKPLRTFAARYAMPHRLWQRTIKKTFDVLSSRGHDSKSMIAPFADLAHDEMIKLSHNVPQMAHEWDLIRNNIQQYCDALDNDGIDMPVKFRRDPMSNHSMSIQHFASADGTDSGMFYGDDPVCEKYFYTYLWNSFDTASVDYLSMSSPCNSIVKAGYIMLNGWLAYGRKIATSFHAFCQTFFFLGFVCALHQDWK